jgi:hypothetical protein
MGIGLNVSAGGLDGWRANPSGQKYEEAGK